MTSTLNKATAPVPAKAPSGHRVTYSRDQQGDHTWLIARNEGPQTSSDSRLDDADHLMGIALIERMAEGDETALAAFYDRYATPLFSLALKIVPNELEAEDVLQEAFVNIWRKAANYKATLSAPFSWAVMIVRFKAIDHIRSQQKNQRIMERAATHFYPEAGIDNHSALEPELREKRAMVRDALDLLEPESREALDLAFFSGMTHDEIAKYLGRPVGTIKSRIRRALSQMRGYVTEVCQT